MRSKTLFAAVIISTIFLAVANAASTEKILFSFDGTNGSGPDSSVIFDKSGNLYGTTSGGGAYGYGTVYKLSRDSDGSWTETILHSFSGAPDGAYPSGALIWDSAGNLYAPPRVWVRVLCLNFRPVWTAPGRRKSFLRCRGSRTDQYPSAVSPSTLKATSMERPGRAATSANNVSMGAAPSSS